MARRRRAAQVAGLVALGGGALAALALAAPGAPGPGTPGGCPLHDRVSLTSSRAGSAAALVPGGAVNLLVCHYSGFVEPPPLPQTGPPHRLIGQGLVTERSRTSSIATELNALPPTTGAYSCPADFGETVVAYFRYSSAPSDPITIGLRGCESITNGHVQRLGLNAAVVTRIAELARPAIVRGRVQVCGGPAPGPCHTETVSGCGPARGSCATSDRVAVITATGRRLVTVRLNHARFSVYVPAGRYRLELLADGGHVHGKVLESAAVRARSGRTTTVLFGISVP